MPTASLRLYKAASSLLAPFAGRFLAVRAAKGKEDPSRLKERRGLAGVARPQGRLVWLHGASIGESLALLPLAERLAERGFHILATTTTKSAATLMAERMPAGAMHQYAPLDAPRFVARFLDHWRPDLAIFAESELWPNLIGLTHARQTPIALVNARMSPRSFKRWLRFPRAIKDVLGNIDMIFAQTDADAQRYARLGAGRIQTIGNLKYDSPPPPADRALLAELSAQIGARPVWVAASTHSGEESLCLRAHARLKQYIPNLLTIIAPRDIARGASIAALAAKGGLVAARRSGQASRRGIDLAIDHTTEVYVADTFGELGLWYRLSAVAFLGKSFARKGDETGSTSGGQNPIEAAKLGVALLHGPHVANFEAVYRALDAAGGALKVVDADGVARALNALFSNAAQLRAMGRAASSAVEAMGGATDAVMQSLEPYLMQIMVGQTG